MRIIREGTVHRLVPNYTGPKHFYIRSTESGKTEWLIGVMDNDGLLRNTGAILPLVMQEELEKEYNGNKILLG